MKNIKMIACLYCLAIVCTNGPKAYSQDTPEQTFFEWTEMPFSKEVYAERRGNMISQLKSTGGGIYLAPASDGFSSGETFRQLNDFMYFTGLELPNSILVIDSDNNLVMLFGPPRDLRYESSTRKNDFPGRPLVDDPELASRSGISDIRTISEFDKSIGEWIKNGRLIKINMGRSVSADNIETGYTTSFTPEKMMTYHLIRVNNEVKLSNGYGDVAQLRMIKSEEELVFVRRAIDITIASIKKAAGYVADGVDERSLEAELEAEFKRLGSPRMGFSSIIKSGPNSLWPWRILAANYDRRNREMENGDLVIFDVGCEYNYYTSDVGRTFPVSGKFSKEQREILEMEISVSDAIINAIKPGITFSELKEIAEAKIPLEHKKYMQVGLFFGHHIGLTTGDPNISDAKLKAGMVFTVEPWYYNHDIGISVFTEDNILVTENGAEVLTAELARSPDELEKMVKKY